MIEEIGPALEALGCYERRDAAIRDVFPDYGAGYKQKVTIAASLLDSDRVNFFNLTVESPSGEQTTRRMGASAYSSVVAATNMKQRARKLIEYFHAESRQLCSARYPEPPRVRAWFLRPRRRRARGPEADRAPLQDPGIRIGGLPRVARRFRDNRRRRAPTPFPRPKRNSTLRCRIRKWTCCCGRGSTRSHPMKQVQ